MNEKRESHGVLCDGGWLGLMHEIGGLFRFGSKYQMGRCARGGEAGCLARLMARRDSQR